MAVVWEGEEREREGWEGGNWCAHRRRLVHRPTHTPPSNPPQAFRHCIDDFVARYTGAGVDVVAGFEARGFIFGPPLALALGVPFVPLRKPGKLPGEVVRVEYELEYGSDVLEMHVDAVEKGAKVVLIDDLVATGGTLAAGIALIEQVGAVVHECAAVIELPELNGRAKLGGAPLYVQVEKAEHTEDGAAEAAKGVEHA